MIFQNNITTMLANPTLVGKRMILGATIGLVVILIFILPVKNTNPDWGKFWMIRPLIITPLAGAMGGLFYSFMDALRHKGGFKKILANIISLMIFLIGLWMGIVLGLDGTLWD
jgi:hypothetical protein